MRRIEGANRTQTSAIDEAPRAEEEAGVQRDAGVGLGPRTTPPPPVARAGSLPRELTDQLIELARRLAQPGELSDAELSAIRSQLPADKRQLQETRKLLERALPPWRKARVRDRGALEGPADANKIMELLGGPGRLGRLSTAKKAEIRRLRDANVEAMLSRAALRSVNGNDGLFRRFNPGDAEHPDGFPIGIDGRPADTIDQRYALVDAVSGMFRVGYGEREIFEIGEMTLAGVVPSARQRAGAEHERAGLAVAAFLDEARARIAKRTRAFEEMESPADVDREATAELANRLSQLRWLETGVAAEVAAWSSDAPAAYREDLAALFKSPDREVIEEALDARFERVMNFAIDAKLRAEGLQPLATVKMERLPAERARDVVDVAKQELGPDHTVRAQLAELVMRLDRGEESAVGVAYAKQTFPEEILERVARGDLKVVAFDGSRENGIRHIRDKFGITENGLRQSCRLMGLQGIYGSYPRTLVTLDDGRQFLLLSGYGSSRQLNNAASLLLYETNDGRRAADIELAKDGTQFIETVREDLREAIQSDEVPTRLVILQNPTHLERLLGESLEWEQAPEAAIVPFYVGYRTFEDGYRERIIIPKVGGGGVYGDTAGEFITAFFTCGFENLIPDVIFNGTAGGFANTLGTKAFENAKGLPDVEPGGVFMPTGRVEQYGAGAGRADAIPSMFGPNPADWPDEVLSAATALGVHLTGDHLAISAPAVETHALIQDIVDRGFASIDVEGAAIMAAARKLGKTCTAIYTHSDDPRASRDEPNASLGMVGPFLEGSRYHGALFQFIDLLWRHSDARFRGVKE